MEKQLDELVKRLEAAFGPRLVSVILYGSAAAGDWQERASDLNVMCICSAVTSREMKQAEPLFNWWTKQGNLPPLLLSEEEVERSTDCFPMEFHDIQERRRVLFGRDVPAELQIDASYYRAFVERELRSKQLRLRQKAVELMGQHERLSQLMLDSVSTFCVLGRHALILGKRPAKWRKKEILAALSDATGCPMKAAIELLDLREAGKKPSASAALQLLEEYLADTSEIVKFVDSLDK